MQAPSGPSCQSCGMPLSRDEQGGGTEADGSRSVEYCSHCYQAGQFTMPSLTAAEMQARVEGMMRSLGMPDAFRERAVAGIEQLRRWQH